jgi:hypothetical protein
MAGKPLPWGNPRETPPPKSADSSVNIHLSAAAARDFTVVGGRRSVK